MSSDPPSVSIIIPVLNRKDNLKRCLDSIFNQDYPKEKVEVIVVDNGSTDGSLEILKNYIVKRKQVKKRNSPYFARNEGVKIASGEILAFSDSNVFASSNQWLKNDITALDSHNNHMVMGLIDPYFLSNTFYKKIEAYDVSKLNFYAYTGISLSVANIFIKKELFYDIGFFGGNIRSGADACWIDCALKRNYHINVMLIFCHSAKMVLFSL